LWFVGDRPAACEPFIGCFKRNGRQPGKGLSFTGAAAPMGKRTRAYKGKLQSVIEDVDLAQPVIRCHCGHGFAKQYVRRDRLPRVEPASNNVHDYRRE